MTRKIVVFGLILLAALLPLAAMPLAVFATGSLPLVAARLQMPAGVDVQAVALLALVSFRAPPSR